MILNRLTKCAKFVASALRAAPANFEQKFHVQQAKLGDTIRLECLATGDQPLKIDWFYGANESSKPLDRNGNEFYEIHETPLGEQAGSASYMQLRSLHMHDSQLYKCLARNEFGSSERIIKLIVSNVPETPSNLRLRDVWSRSALISWSAGPQTIPTSNGRATNFTVQFWRKTTAGAKQNHRRESLVVDGLQTSALLPNLLPALTYEVSVIGQNQVGQSEPSETIQVTTSEEEPSAPPTDVQVDTRGAGTIRVMWKAPPAESLNGKLLGFYIGYRPRSSLSSMAPQLNSVIQTTVQQQQLAPIFSFKTVDAIEGLANYESFLANLKPMHEYEVTVRAFNKAGSGPDCHVLVARTGFPRLPGAPTLQVQRVTSNAVALRWTAAPQPARQLAASASQLQLGAGQPLHQSAGVMQQHFELFYQIQGEHDWYQLSVGQAAVHANAGNHLDGSELLGQTGGQLPSQPSDELAAVNIHTLSNLQPALTYRIYVAAANELGLGDPSNVVTVKTSELASNSVAQLPGLLGSAQLDSSLLGDALHFSASSSASHLLDVLTQPQHGHFYTLLSSLALILMLVSLLAYFIWQRRLKCKYNSSNASSYPSSWTPAASDTIQSEYSIKRLPSSTIISNHQLQSQQQQQEQRQQQRQQQQQQQQDLYDEVECVVAQHQQQQRSQRATLSGNSHLQSGRLGPGKQLRNSSTISRPVLSSHYHLPASLIGSSGSAATLQFHQHHQHPQQQQQQQQHANQSGRQVGASGAGQQFKMSATLNRHQNRQLPPIPYSTMTMQKETSGLTSQQPGSGAGVGQTGAKQSRPVVGYSAGSAANNNFAAPGHCGSQTPLIYGPIE